MRNDRIEDDDRRLSGIDVHDQSVAIVVEQRLRFPLVSFQPLPDDLLIRIIEAIVLDRSLFQSRDDLATIRTAQVKHLSHVDERVHQGQPAQTLRGMPSSTR